MLVLALCLVVVIMTRGQLDVISVLIARTVCIVAAR